MWVTQCHKPSPNHHFYRWYKPFPVMGGKNDIVLPTLPLYTPIWYYLKWPQLVSSWENMAQTTRSMGGCGGYPKRSIDGDPHQICSISSSWNLTIGRYETIYSQADSHSWEDKNLKCSEWTFASGISPSSRENGASGVSVHKTCIYRIILRISHSLKMRSCLRVFWIQVHIAIFCWWKSCHRGSRKSKKIRPSWIMV